MTPKKPRLNLWYILIFVWLAIFLHDFAKFNTDTQAVPYSQFLTYLQQGRIAEVSVGQERIEGLFKEQPKNRPKGFVTQRVPDPNLTDELRTAGVKFSGMSESSFFGNLLSWLIPAVLFLGIWVWLIGRMGQSSRGIGPLQLGKSRAKIYVEKDLKVRFEDVAGVEEAKDELKEIVNFLRDPVRYSKLGGRMPKGVLLVGPPGTGKTLLARAVAGEAGVPFFSINGSEFVELFVGLGAARVRDLFEQGRAHAPCIIFIDELDALGKARGLSAITGSANDEKEQTLNQLLAELDGFDPSVGVIILASTNRPEVLDPALLRAGRFDRHIAVDKPDRSGRVKILQIHLRKVKLATQFNPESLAAITVGFSGADLANLVNEAALIATRRGAEAVEQKDFMEAVERIIAGLERKNRLLNPNEKRRVAFHEMGHAIVGLAVGDGEAVHKVSIIPRGIAALGYTLRRPTEDRYLLSKGELESKIAVALGGRASEMVFFDEISTGAADDLDKATEIARAMITRYGMSESLGLTIYEHEPTPLLGSQMPVRSYEFSQKTAEALDQEIRDYLNRSLNRALEIVKRYRDMIEEGAMILLNKETIDEAEIKVLWDKHVQPSALPKIA